MRLALLLLLIAAGDSSRKPGDCDGPCPMSKIDHVVIIVQENHTFDTYFGMYCQAAAARNPTCTAGPNCCAAGVSVTCHAVGYDQMVTSQKGGLCPKPPADCDIGVSLYPCVYDVGDFPVDYYAEFADNAKYLRDYKKFKGALDNSTLPQVAWVRGLGYHSEHPGTGVRLSDGITFVKQTIDDIEHSAYAKDTLVLVTWDEGGGYYDHIAPPGMGTDNQPYGTRVPLHALGPGAKANGISHVQMEHSSIGKFIECNWTGQTGQRAGRDASVNNLGSLLDPAATGTQVPE